MPANLDPTGRNAATRGAFSAARRLASAARARLESARGEDGFLLIEVIVSAMLVALIVVGTFNGFDVANRLSTAERQHEQAAALAAASQEQLRSEPASVLQTLQANPHSYTQTVQGTIYTVKQSAELQPAGKSTGGACNVTQSSHQSGNAYRITSRVSWKQQEATSRPPVTASSLITPPIGSSLEVDVLSSPGSSTGVSGVTVNIKYKPQGSSGTASQSQTTGSEGCVLFGAVPSLEAEVEVVELLGYVTVDGKSAVPNKTVSLAPNYTVHDNVVYNRAGAIQANFAYNGSATAAHKNNEETSEVTQTVTGDTFLAGQQPDGSRTELRARQHELRRENDDSLRTQDGHLPGVGDEQEQPVPVLRSRKRLLDRLRGGLHRQQPRNRHRRSDQAAGKSDRQTGRNAPASRSRRATRRSTSTAKRKARSKPWRTAGKASKPRTPTRS